MGRRIHILVLCLLVASGVSQGESLVGTATTYFGHLHNHTGLSDGSGTPAQAYSTAKAAGLDFFGLSDHGEQLTADEYAQMQAAADAANEPDVFSTFYGFEWSSGTYGHITVVNPATFASASNSATDTFSEFMNWLNTNGGIAFFNHPGRNNSSGMEFEHFTGAYSGRIVGMELWNKDSILYYNSGYTSDNRDRSGHYDEALTNGWFIGAAGSQDHHGSTWGDNSWRLAVLSGSNSRQAIYDALSTQCFYSTLDKNLELSFQIDGHEMGSGTAGGSNQCVVRAADRDGEGFSTIEIIRNGYIVHTEYMSNATLPVITCKVSTQVGDYLYCKVTQTDGDEAISSPVFITSSGPDGPPRADMAVPLDNGPDDIEPADDQVTVNTTQLAFQIQLADFEGIADGTVTPSTVSVVEPELNVDYVFAYNSDTDVITLTPGAVFGNGVYTVTVSGISDLAYPPNTMADTALTVRIDTSIVAPQTLHFQQGLNGYGGTADTMICAGAPNTSYASTSNLNIDNYDVSGGISQVLLDFAGIVGEAADQIPPGASISSAILRLNSLDTGNGGHLHAMLQPWSDTSTWNSLANGIQTDDVEASSVADDSVGTTSVGDVDLNVTGTVQSWVNGMENNGWAMLPNGTDGSHIASAEYGTTGYRPELIVTFTATGGSDVPPVANAGEDRTVADDDGDGVELVTLNGSASYPAASIVSYIWTVGGVQVANTAVAQNVPFSAPGVYHVTLTVTNGTGLSDTDEVVITVEVPSLFSEDFESGGFTAGGWVTGGQATVETTSARSGSYGVLLKKTSSAAATVYTGGAASATFIYWARTSGLNNEYLYVEWSQDGGAWQGLNALTGTTGWAQFSHNLSPAPSSFMIRFRTNGNAGNDMAMIDDIVITGAIDSGNAAPSAIGDSAVTNEDGPVTIPVLANDTDPDSDALAVFSFTPASKGTVVSNGTTVTYTPNENANGEDSFTYTITDGRGGTSTATVTVTINPVDDPPVAANDAVTTIKGTTVTISVLANDTDPDGDPLTILSVTQASDGAVASDGTVVTYTPDAGYIGSDSFFYTLTGGATAVVNVTVTDTPMTMTVSVEVGRVRINAPLDNGLAIVTVVDDLGNPVPDAMVTGRFIVDSTVGVSETSPTDANGKVEFMTASGYKKATFAFEVISVTHESLTWEP